VYKDITLQYPVQVDGVELKSIKIRRPKVRDMLAASKTAGQDDEKELQLFSNLCELPPETIKDLDIADYAKLQETFKGFLP